MGIAAVIAGIVTISGCGTDESTAGITLVASETLAKADMEEEMGYALDDDDVTVDAPTITVQTGREVTLTLENRAGQYSKVRASHDFAVVPPLDDQYTDVDMYTDIATLKIDDKVLWGARTPQIFTDDSATTTFVPDAPGTYQYICTIAGHASRGMRGTLIVEDPE
jgi:plastocyanin